jgi:hypothetical protein
LKTEKIANVFRGGFIRHPCLCYANYCASTGLKRATDLSFNMINKKPHEAAAKANDGYEEENQI